MKYSDPVKKCSHRHLSNKYIAQYSDTLFLNQMVSLQLLKEARAFKIV